MQVVVNGLLTSYEMSGQGKVVVMLHGWGDRASGLKGLQVELAKQYLVITPDLPGFGGSESPPETWGLDDYDNFIQHFLEKIGQDTVYAMVGHSNGGAMVIRGLATGKLAAEKLVLLASAGMRDVFKGRRRVLGVLAKGGKALTLPLPSTIRQKVRRKAYGAIGSDLFVAEHLQESFKRVVTDDVQKDARRINIPTLIIYGESDNDTPVQFGEKFHELIKTSILEILPGAGHFVHLDRADQVYKAVTEFLG